jgi:hypothetical protein
MHPKDDKLKNKTKVKSLKIKNRRLKKRYYGKQTKNIK